MTITKLTIEVLATNMEVLRLILGHTLKLNEKKTGTFVEGFTFPDLFKQYAITFPRGGAIIPGISPEQLGEMICRAAYYRFHSIKDSLEKSLQEVFGVPVPLKFNVNDGRGHWTLEVSSSAIPMDWWNDDVSGDQILTECFFEGSIVPMTTFHDLENWKRHIQENAAIQKRRREQQYKEEEAFLNDATRSLRITMFISNTKSQVVMDMTGTPVQLLQHVFKNAWAWGEKIDVYKRGFRFRLNGIERKEDWIFYASVNDLCAALKTRWPVAYERAEATQS